MKTWLIALRNSFSPSISMAAKAFHQTACFIRPVPSPNGERIYAAFNCLSGMKNAFAKSGETRWEEEKLIKTTKHYKFYLCSRLAQFVRFKWLGAFEPLWNEFFVRWSHYANDSLCCNLFIFFYDSGTFLMIFRRVAFKKRWIYAKCSRIWVDQSVDYVTSSM